MRIRKRLPVLAAALAALLLPCACGPAPGAAGGGQGGGAAKAGAAARPAADPRLAPALAALEAAPLAPEVRERIRARVLASPGPFLAGLDAVLAVRAADPSLFLRADKERRLPADFVPEGLEGLDGSGLSLSRKGHSLRRPAFEALLAMDAAARAKGVVLLVGSTYRSFAYQKEVFDRSVAAEGLAETERSVAPPGASQHQLGTALDFAPIDEAFASTQASRWLAANASRFGFSLSFPEGLEAETGYKPESWHYRYLGRDATALADAYFEGVQHRFLLFLERR